jgi:glycosyltransferase involved in cell wall biosynthesis
MPPSIAKRLIVLLQMSIVEKGPPGESFIIYYTNYKIMRGNKNILADVTVVIPCYNEGEIISDTIEHLKSVGFTNILIVGDNSGDDTYLRAEKEKVSFLENRRNMGFDFSILKGLYEVKTKYAFVSTPDIIFEKDSLLDYISWGIKGNYSLLFSKRKKSSIFPNLAPLLRKRYGISISEPLLDVAFVDDSLLNKIKKQTISEEFILLELVRIVMKNNLKLGTYDLETKYPNYLIPFRSLKGYSHRLRKEIFRWFYLMRAFPKEYKESRRNKVISGVVIVVLGYFIINYYNIISSLIKSFIIRMF